MKDFISAIIHHSSGIRLFTQPRHICDAQRMAPMSDQPTLAISNLNNNFALRCLSGLIKQRVSNGDLSTLGIYISSYTLSENN